MSSRKEYNKDGRNDEENNEEEVTSTNKVQTDGRETIKETEDWIDLENISQEIEEWKEDEIKKSEEHREERRKNTT